MLTVLVVVHLLICFVLVLSILLQSGKGGSLAGAFGGAGAAGAVLGTRGAATMLSKITTYAAILFLVSCMGLSFMFRGGSGTQVQTAAQKEAARRGGLTPLSAPAQQTPAQPAEKK
jgi:preprotein translocase subunit SecG